MEIRARKTKLMTNNTSVINTEVKVNGQTLETVTSFKCLRSVVTDESSQPEVLFRIAQRTAALRISYKDHANNEEVRAKIQQAIGPHADLTIVKRGKLK